jgi:8-oxo-dGTP diphosphatase
VIFLVRHAHAESRSDWDGPDRGRPLSDKGHLQAKRLAELLISWGAGSVVSSPFLRCVQTVLPLANVLGVAVDESAALAEGAGGEEAARLIAVGSAGTVICSHGDVLHDVVGRLAAGGAPVDTGTPFEKGAVLWLERDGTSVIRAGYEAPPN